MKSTCRLCGNIIKKPFLSLGNSPVSNAYLTGNDLSKMEPYYPLELFVCTTCFMVQVEEYELHQNIFNENYAYFSSYSQSWLKHCEEYVVMMMKRFDFNQNTFVMEIASNDGYLLQYFKERNVTVLGIEPTSNTAKVAIQKGIPTDIKFFNTEYAEGLKTTSKLPDLIIGNNVLAHNPKLNDFVEGLRVALAENGIVTMEFPHLLNLIGKNEFDTVYHEHYSYFSFYTVKQLFDNHDLTIFDVEEIPTHGGSLRIYAKHKANGKYTISENVRILLNKEESMGLKNEKTYIQFAKNVEKIKRDLLIFLIEARETNKKVVGYGAPAKGNTLLNYCGIRSDMVEYTVDLNPHKQNMFLPGVHLPIYSPEKIIETKPDFVLILPWNIKEEIMSQMNHIKDWGGKFVVAIPNLQVL